uniref:Uncharacterized protein n=1 Tax=Globodera pallida TaxID=36090 RepID=A0A183CA99_GLOPA
MSFVKFFDRLWELCILSLPPAAASACNALSDRRTSHGDGKANPAGPALFGRGPSSRLRQLPAGNRLLPKVNTNHDNGSIHCRCRNLDLERVMAHPEQRLPLDVARLHLHHRGPEQHQIWVTSPKLSGCYRCTAGAVFEAKCQTDHGITLAKVKFADGTLFALHCGDNGTTTVESIPFDLAEVFTEYRVKCPAGATTFDYRGSLPFSPNNSNSNSGKGSPEVADMNREAPGGYGGWRSTGDLEERTVWEPSPPQEEVSWPMSTRRLPTNPRRKKKPKKK